MPIAGISEYRVYINNNYDTSTTNPFIQLNLQSKGIYNITITAVNGSIESAPSNIASFVSGIYPPSFPLGVQAQNNQNGIMVSWNAPTPMGVIRFNIIIFIAALIRALMFYTQMYIRDCIISTIT